MEKEQSRYEYFDQLRSQVIDALRAWNEAGVEEGEEKENALNIYHEWIGSQEERRNLNELTDLDIALEYAELYIEAGMLDTAIEHLEDAADVAYGNKEYKRCEEIEQRIAELKKQE